MLLALLLLPLVAAFYPPGIPCPPKFELFGEKCFYVSSANSSDWIPFPKAELACLIRGSNLATISNAEEDQFLAARTDDRYWYHIGLIRIKLINKWIWINGDPSNYRNFTPGLNLTSADADHAVLTFEKTWGYVKNSEVGPYICSRRARAVPTGRSSPAPSSSPAPTETTEKV